MYIPAAVWCHIQNKARSFRLYFASLIVLIISATFFVLPSYAQAATNVSGTISQNTTWSQAGSPYVIGSVTVAQGVNLTIEPGVVVKGSSTSSKISVQGSLNADGVVFTSYKDDAHAGDTNGDGSASSPAPGNWSRIEFMATGSGQLINCSVLWGGYYSGAGYRGAVAILDSTAAIGIAGTTVSGSSKYGITVSAASAGPLITGSTITNNSDGGLYSEAAITALSGNTFSNNDGPAVKIPAVIGPSVNSNTYSGNNTNAMVLTGNINSDATWVATNSPYLIGSANVAEGATLNVQSGSVVKFSGQSTSLTVEGALVAEGTVFTSFKDDSHGGDSNSDGSATMPGRGDWKHIFLNNTDASILNNCSILWGGYFTGTSGMVSISANAPVDISGSTFSQSNTFGIYVYLGSVAPAISGSTISGSDREGLYSEVALETLYGNVFTDNGRAAVTLPAIIGNGVYNNTYSSNQRNGMEVRGHITRNTTWGASNSPYLVVGEAGYYGDPHLDVYAGSSLTIEPGAVVKPLGTDTEIEVLGILNAHAAIFTSIKDDSHGGDANGDGNATQAMPGDWYRINFRPGSWGIITDTIVKYGGNRPDFADRGEISVNSTLVSITGSAVSHSNSSGIYVGAGSNPSIHFNDIFTNPNTYYGLKSETSGLDATNNWWGGIGGPKPYGTGNAVLDANVEPWSDVPFTQAGAEAQAMGTDTWCGAYGEPVNTSTGAFYYSHTDVDIPTRGLPLKFERTYNSNDGNDGPLGHGWSFDWQVSTNPRANGDVVILRGDGRRDTFILNPDGSFSPPAGRHDTLSKNPDGTYRLLLSDQTIHNFGTNNRLASVVSETGQMTTFTYDGNKRLVAITETAGRSLTLTYTPENRIDEITDPQGNTVSFAYSTEGNLTQVTDQNGGITAYGYDAAHRITAITDPNGSTFVNNTYDNAGRVVEQTDAEGNLLTFAYDTANQQTAMTRRMDPNDSSKDQVTIHEYDSQLRLVRETDPYGKATVYTYDAAGNRDSVTDRRGVTTRTIYDASGNVTDLYKAYGRPEQQHIHFSYNARNKPLTMTDARGYATSYAYDASETLPVRIDYPQVTNYDGTLANYFEAYTYNTDGTVATATDRNGDVTSYTYDAYGNPDTVTRNTNRAAADQVTLDYDFDALGRKTAFTDGNGHRTSFEYSPIGDLRFIRTTVINPESGLPEDLVTEYHYDANGNKTAVVDPEGKTASYAYTAMDNLRLVTDAKLNTIEHTYDAAYNRTATRDRNGNWTHFDYDKNNRMVAATDPEGNVTTYALDEEGNVVTETDPLGRALGRNYDGLGRLTSVSEPDEGGAQRTTVYAYDVADNLVATTDPAGNTFAQTFDELSRLKAATDPLGASVYHRYDGAGNRTKSKDQRGYETAFTYSPNDWLAAVTDPLGGVTAYAYDKNGNLTSQTDAEGRVTQYGYDELGRIVNEKVDAGSGTYLMERSYAYDRAGNLRKDTTGEGTITYSYDDVYNPVAITDRQGATYSFAFDANGNRLSATDNAAGKTVSFAYDSRGLLATATGAHGAVESFAYDSAGNLVRRDDAVAGQNFTTTFAHTPRNQVKNVIRGADNTTFTYDATGNLAAKTYPNGVNTAYAYDAASRLTGLETTKNSQALKSYTQTYDPAGNITTSTEQGTGATTYSYDPLNRLTSESIPAYGGISYTYDRAGNRLTQTEPKPAAGPALSLSLTRTYWASWADYQNRLLSLDYRLNNAGPGTAYQTKVTHATATNGVTLNTPTPLATGDIAQGNSAPFTLKYYVPFGVTGFNTTVYSTAKDQGGAEYYYPERRSFSSYNQANQLTSLKDESGAATAFSYNSGGYLAHKTTGADVTTYAYNGLDKLTQVSTPQTTVSYAYDALGRRIQRSEGAETRNIHLSGASDLENYHTDQTGALTSSFVKGADGLISETDHTGPSPATSYHLYNPHGDTAALADQSGTVTASYRYDSFGNAIGGASPRNGYTGKWQRDSDSATGTVRMGVREYDPALGRFTSADPLKGVQSSPQARNRYPYALNDPLVVYDLNGRFAIAPAVAVGAVVFVAVLAYETNPSVQEANEEVLSEAWEGLEGTASTAWSDYEWVGPVAGEWLGSLWGGSEVDRSPQCQIPPLELDDLFAGNLTINYKTKTENREGKASDEFDRLTRGRTGGAPVPSYEGTGYRYPDGTFIGIRRGSDETPTVDTNIPGEGPRKYKYKEW